jgi:hypothetical protein
MWGGTHVVLEDFPQHPHQWLVRRHGGGAATTREFLLPTTPFIPILLGATIRTLLRPTTRTPYLLQIEAV